MESPEKIVQRITAKAQIAKLQAEQVTLNGAIDYPFGYCQQIYQATGLRINPDLFEDLCRIQLSRNAHAIGAHEMNL